MKNKYKIKIFFEIVINYIIFFETTTFSSLIFLFKLILFNLFFFYIKLNKYTYSI